MEVTTRNYFKTIERIGLSELPAALADAHQAITQTTREGRDWTQYNRDARFKRVANLAFTKLKEFISSDSRKALAGVRPVKDKRYSNIATECMFIDRFLAFHGKVLYKNTFGIFIDDLQKAIEAKKIRKTSPVAKEIMEIQQAAIKQFNRMYNADYFVLKPETIKRFNEIVARWENSYDDIDEGYAKSKKAPVGLEGVQAPIEPAISAFKNEAIMSSEDFAKAEFETIGLKNKWLKLIGDPSPGFKAMVFGMPKMGKSYLCIDFASYLSKNHGKVLYISKEEFLSPTLALKIKDKDAANINLDIAGTVPSDLSAYRYVFLDSVTSLKLAPDDLKALEQKYPGISFIYVFQVTKAGSARGTNEYMHNVDVVIEIPERGKAIQFGRFNQGGKMDIFDAAADSLIIPDAVPTLEGVKKKDMKEPSNGVEFSDVSKMPNRKIHLYAEVPEVEDAYDVEREQGNWDSIDLKRREEILATGGYGPEYAKLKGKELAPAVFQLLKNWREGWKVESDVRGYKDGLFWPKNLNRDVRNEVPRRWERPEWAEPAHLTEYERGKLGTIYFFTDVDDDSPEEQERKTKRAAKLYSLCNEWIAEQVPPNILRMIGQKKILISEGHKTVKKKIAERVQADATKQLTALEKIVKDLAGNEVPSWYDVLDLGNLHDDLGNRLIKKYNPRKHRSNSVFEGIEKRRSGCETLLREVAQKLDQCCSELNLDQLYRWNNYLSDMVHLYNKLKKNQLYRPRD